MLKESKFSIGRFKHNQAHFRFYTGFDSYDLFKVVLDYLEPLASSLSYWCSNTSPANTMDAKHRKRGRQRQTATEEEFYLVLVLLRNAFPIQDLSVRFGISTSNISRILITWTDFLHSQFRMIPIWAPKETIRRTMPQCFRKIYPHTRIILDCTEIFIQMPTSFRSQLATFSNYKHHNTAKGLI